MTTTTGLTSNSLAFFYIGPPKVTAVTPNAGPLTTASLTLSGQNLANDVRNLRRRRGSPEIVITSNDTLSVLAPEHA